MDTISIIIKFIKFKRNPIYIIVDIIAIVLIMIGSIFFKYNVFSSCTIGIGCSALTAAIMSMLIDYRDYNEEQNKLEKDRNIYFKSLYNELKVFLQEILWFDEKIDDKEFDWELDTEIYNSFEYFIFANTQYEPIDITYNEAMERLKECQEKYKLDKISDYDNEKQKYIQKMFLIVSKDSKKLKKMISEIKENVLILSLGNLISVKEIKTLEFNISLAINCISNNNVNKQIMIKLLVQSLNFLRKIGNYTDNDWKIALRLYPNTNKENESYHLHSL